MKKILMIILSFFVVLFAEEKKLETFENNINKSESEYYSDKNIVELKSSNRRSSIIERIFGGILSGFVEAFFTYEDEDGEEVFDAVGFFQFMFFPYWGPYSLLDDDYTENDFFGLREEKKTRKNSQLGILNLSYGNQILNKDIYSYYISSTLYYKRLHLDFVFQELEEDFDNKKEYLQMGDVLFSWVFAKNENWIFKTGVGYKAIYGENKHHPFKWLLYDITYLKGALSFNYNYSLIYNEENVMSELNTGLGGRMGNFTLNLEYSSLKVYDESLDGPRLRLTYWF